MLVITSGMLQSFCECSQKYNLIYNEHLDIPSNLDFPEVGKKIHALINYKFKGFDIEKQLQILNFPENKELYILWQNFLDFKIDTVENSELTFTIPLNQNIKLTGRVDAIRKVNDCFEILDWKTGASKNINPENSMQTIIYLFAIYKLLSFQKKIDLPDNLSLTYFFLKEKKSKTVSFSTDKLILYESTLLQKAREIVDYNSNDFSPCCNCKNCSFKIVCNQAYKLNKNML